MTESISRAWLLARPGVTEGAAGEIAERCFGVRGHAIEVGSQQDRNFAVRGETGDGILLKIDNAATDDATREFQALVGGAIAAAGVATPAAVASLDGADTRVVTAAETVVARAFQWIEGRPLADEMRLSGFRAEQLGTLAGRAATGLRGIEHPAADRDIQWELGRANAVIEELAGALPEERRAECLAAARRADAAVSALSHKLLRQVIHGDITADNVLCDAAGTLWVVDLGDAAMSWRVAELAVTAADVLGRTGSIAQVGRVVRGFCAEAELSEPELAALWPLIVLRGAVLAVSGWSQLDIDPGNDYARERLEHEWEVFARAAAIDPAEAEAQLRLAAGLPHRSGTQYAPLAGASPQPLDLGVASELLDRGAWLEPGIEQRLAEQALAAAPVVAAPFGQARLSRVSPRADAPAAARSRAIELWAAPGTELVAPFAGELGGDDEALELADLGVVLRLSGAARLAANGRVRAGQVIARVPAGLPVLVSRRWRDAAPDPTFAAFDGEYETDGALDPSLIVGVCAVADPELELRGERTRRDAAMGGASERYYAEPPRIERGWGALLIETRGRAYLDMVNNVTAIGHSHPRLADSVARQLNLLNTNSRFLYGLYADFTSRLLEHSPDPALDVVIPVSSGSEANDLALRLAQVATGRKMIVAAREGYHGWTMASDAVSTSAFDNPHAADSRPDWVDIVSAPNEYRGRFRGEGAAERYVAELRERLAELAAAGRAPAAFISEPVLGNAGGVIPPAGYLAGAYAAIREAGGVAIADEVQVGYGRLGSHFWGSELAGAVPDIITVAKAAGNAFPLGAVITKREIVDALREEGMFFSSSGGAPASMAAGLAVLDVIRDEGLQENARVVGEHLIEKLRRLGERHPMLGEVHGSGLYLGVELVRDRATLEPATEATREVCERLLAHGVIMQATSERQNVLKVKPPMTLTIAQADVFVAALDRVMSEVESLNL
ncbi:aminotransferase [Leucobacter albus]|uniref:Aminotransferase n=1 Tax=Leucobacter albus TaxID=272210 RepID=A0ABW3TQ46_9MICO